MQKKKNHIELLRIIAIFLVMFNHTQNGGFFYFAENQNAPLYYVYLSFSILCKIAVPIFYMITGALLLKKDETVATVLKKRFLKYVFILLGVSLFYYFWLYENCSIADFFEKVYSIDITTGLWYLYSYLGIIIMLPILRNLVKNLDKKIYHYMFVCHIVFVGIIPIGEYLIWQGTVTLNSNFSAVLFTTSNVFYVLLGYYCENILCIEEITKKRLVGLCLLAACAIAISCMMTDYVIRIQGTQDRTVLQQFFSALISIPSFAAFLLLRKLGTKKINPKFEQVVTEVGGSVFGAYLLEKLIRSFTGYVYGGLYPVIGQFWASVIWTVVGMSLGLLIVILTKRIPLIGKYIRRVM